MAGGTMQGGTTHDRWESHLDTLGVMHYVVAGFIGLFALFPLIHVAMGLGMVSGGGASSSRPSLAGCSS